jgi:WhiB family redox-sensing transcriptional regulator
MFSFLPEPDYPNLDLHGTPPCAEADPDAFFMEDAFEGSLVPGKGVYRHEREAKMICKPCPYRHECLAYAMKRPDIQGIWGGTTEKERVRIRKGLYVSPKLPESRNL